MSQNPDAVTHIRAAVAHERAAAGHEDKYENQMKAAGASMYAAFAAAAKAAPEHQGRKIDDKALLRLYKGTAPRPWWDAALAAAKLTTGSGKADRDHAKRLIQWHVDLDGARARRAQHAIACVSGRKKLSKERTSAARGSRETPKQSPAAPSTAAMRAIAPSAGASAAGGFGAGPEEGDREWSYEYDMVTLEDLLGEVARLQIAAKKVEAGHRADALAAVRHAARQIERYVP